MTDVDIDPDPSIYTVGWISAISTELVAAREFLDKEHSRLSNQAPNDSNIYTLGEIAGHNVVIAVLPDGEYGTSSAASVATDMLRTFKNIKIGLMVGVGGGAPSRRDDIRLGDVVVSSPRAGKSGVFQYDYGKTIQGCDFEHTRSLAPPPPLLLAAVNDLKGRFEASGHHIAEDIEAIIKKKPRLGRNYSRPEPDSDRLYKSDYIHSDPFLSCIDGCGNETHNIVHRRQRGEYEDDPTIHYGLIASSNRLMKDALLRDKLVGEHQVLCFEMEAAGLMNHFPCLVIRGVCDYSDTHKNKRWQGYSAMTAAAYTKEILRLIPPARVQAEQSLAMSIHTMDEKLDHIISDTQRLMTAKENDEIIEWLSPPDSSVNYEQALKGLHHDAGSWYLTSQQFKEWRAAPRSVLCIYGIAGSGKTSLSAAAIRVLWTTCIYFFFDFRDPEKHTVEQLLRSLVFQLYSKPSMKRARYWLKENFSALMRGHEKPLDQRLYSALKGMLEMASGVHIVIDALDESTSQQGIRKFIRSVTVECNVRILLTYRESSPIDSLMSPSSLGPIPVFRRQMSGDGLIKEIWDYVSRRAKDKNENWSPGLSPMRITMGVCTKANVLFRLAVCQLDHLKTCVNKQDLDAELRRLPSTLDEIYSKSLERIPEIQRSRAMRLLSLLAYSSRPLSEKEAKHALSLRTGTEVCWENELDWQSIKEITLSLTTETTVEIFGAQFRAIQLAHSSVKDFLLSQSKCSFWCLTQSKICTAETCLTYLLQFSKESRQTIDLSQHQSKAPRVLLRNYPFSGWAANNWTNVAKSQEVQHAILSQITQLFQDEHAFWFWRAIIKDQVPKNVTEPLDLASYFDLSIVVKKLLNEGLTDHQMNSAFAAVCAGNSYKSALVLSRTNATVPFYLLDTACLQGNFKLVQALTIENNTFEPGVFDVLLRRTILSLYGNYEQLAIYLILVKGARWHTLPDQGFMDVSFRKLCLEKKTKLVKLLTKNGLDFGLYTCQAVYIARRMLSHDIAQFLIWKLVGKPVAVGNIPEKQLGRNPATTSAIAWRASAGGLIKASRITESLVALDTVVRAPHQYGYSGTRWSESH